MIKKNKIEYFLTFLFKIKISDIIIIKRIRGILFPDIIMDDSAIKNKIDVKHILNLFLDFKKKNGNNKKVKIENLCK